MIGYLKVVEARYIRVKHLVTIGNGSRAIDVSAHFKPLPCEAILRDVIFNDDGTVTFEFREEKVDG